MKLEQAVEILEQHNEWRKSGDMFEGVSFDSLTEAIEMVCLEVRRSNTKIFKQSQADIDKKLMFFSTWWAVYDKKVGREKTEKKWLTLSFEDIYKCIEVTPEYVKSKPDKQFRLHPVTFLNNKSWNDEIITPNNQTNGKSISEVGDDVYSRIMSKYSDSNDNSTNESATDECDFEVVDR